MRSQRKVAIVRDATVRCPSSHVVCGLARPVDGRHDAASTGDFGVNAFEMHNLKNIFRGLVATPTTDVPSIPPAYLLT